MSALEEALVHELGERIGYGHMMHLAEKIWRKKLIAMGLPGGGEFAVGPCVGTLVPCPCPESGRDANGHCEWCCGSHRVTKIVREAIEMFDDLALAGELMAKVST